VSHDPNNKDCPCNKDGHWHDERNCPDCTCPPAVDEQMDMNSTDAMYWAEQLVKTLDENPHINFRDTEWLMGWFANYWAAVHDPLARIVDQLKGRVDHNYKMAQEYKAGLAAAQGELERVRAEYSDLLYQVDVKIPNETRHETTKRWLIERRTRETGASTGANQ
jgi:hypothetical protein